MDNREGFGNLNGLPMAHGFDGMTICQAAVAAAGDEPKQSAGHGHGRVTFRYLGVTAGGTPCSPYELDSDDEPEKAEQAQAESLQPQSQSQSQSQSHSAYYPDEHLIAKGLMEGRLKKDDLKGDLDPWLLAQRNLLDTLKTVNDASAKMPADASDRESSAKRNFLKMIACEMNLEAEEENLKVRRS